MMPTGPDPSGPVLEYLLGQIKSLQLIDQPHQSHGRWYSHLLAIEIRGRDTVMIPVKLDPDFFPAESEETEA